MQWILKAINILDEPADALVVPANQSLLLTGAVGAALAERYGPEMQSELRRIVAARSHRYISQGEVIPYTSPALPYKILLHAVAVDTWQNSTSKIVCATATRALKAAAAAGAAKVALAALGTGSGNLTLPEFAQGIRMMIDAPFPSLEQTTICLLEPGRIAELAKLLPEATVA